jgi:hypothetical protein
MKTKLITTIAMALIIVTLSATAGTVFARLAAPDVFDVPITVNISGKVLVHVYIGAGPYAGAEFDTVNHVEAHALGTTSSLMGKGAVAAPPGEEDTLVLTGSVTGHLITLDGTITRSTYPFLEGANVEITGNPSTGDITYSADGGPWQITVTTISGSGTVILNNA